MLNLFLATWPITRYGQVALSTMGFGFVNVLVPLIYFRKLRFRPIRALGAAVVSIGLLLGVVIGGMSLSPLLLSQADDPRLTFTLDPALTRSVKVTLERAVPTSVEPAPPGHEVTLAAIQARGVLRVGYNQNVIPFSYLNDHGDLVGFDISYAYELARDLDATELELVPFDWQLLSGDLAHGPSTSVCRAFGSPTNACRLWHLLKSYYESPIALMSAPSVRAISSIGRPSSQYRTSGSCRSTIP